MLLPDRDLISVPLSQAFMNVLLTILIRNRLFSIPKSLGLISILAYWPGRSRDWKCSICPTGRKCWNMWFPRSKTCMIYPYRLFAFTWIDYGKCAFCCWLGIDSRAMWIFALEGLGKLLNTIKIIQGRLNPELQIEGFLLTMYDPRLRLSKPGCRRGFRSIFSKWCFETIITRNIKLSGSPKFRKTGNSLRCRI